MRLIPDNPASIWGRLKLHYTTVKDSNITCYPSRINDHEKLEQVVDQTSNRPERQCLDDILLGFAYSSLNNLHVHPNSKADNSAHRKATRVN